MEFSLWDAAMAGQQIGSPINRNAVTVNNGLFTVQLGFPPSSFAGSNRWLEVAVRSSPSDPFTELTPRQPLTVSPYALYALGGPGGTGYWTGMGNDICNTNAGMVGVGTDTPQATLHVAGDIRSDGSFGVRAHNPNNALASVSLGWLNDVARIRIGGDGAGATSGLDIQKSGDCSLLRLYDNGNAWFRGGIEVAGFGLTYAGTSDGAEVSITNPANNEDALDARSDGTGAAVHGGMTGTGYAGYFEIANAGNHREALVATTNGLGHAGYFENSNASNSESALYAYSNGSGYALEAHGGNGVYGKADHPAGYGGAFSGTSEWNPALLVTGVSDLLGKVRVGSGGTFDDNAKIAVLGGTGASDGGYMVLGDVHGKNISFDNNEIQARDAGRVPSTLNLNPDGGDVKLGGAVDIRYAISHTGTCPSGLKVVGGGCRYAGEDDCVLSESRPADDGGSWVCGSENITGGFCAGTMTSYAICLAVK